MVLNYKYKTTNTIKDTKAENKEDEILIDPITREEIKYYRAVLVGTKIYDADSIHKSIFESDCKKHCPVTKNYIYDETLEKIREKICICRAYRRRK